MLLVVSVAVLLILPVTAKVVPSKVRFVWACAEVVDVPFAVNTRFAAGVRIAVNPGPVVPVGPVEPVGPVGPCKAGESVVDTCPIVLSSNDKVMIFEARSTP